MKKDFEWDEVETTLLHLVAILLFILVLVVGLAAIFGIGYLSFNYIVSLK
jgi:hypothetical protein